MRPVLNVASAKLTSSFASVAAPNPVIVATVPIAGSSTNDE